MAATTLLGTSGVAGAGGSDSERNLRKLAADLIFLSLAVLNTVRLLGHAMWRDELHAFLLAVDSTTALDLFDKLKYEGHPGLWHLILWVITRFTSDPIWMQVAQLLIALGVWILIWRASPFRPVEKILLLLSYYLFWEYFVLSRPYMLAALLGFGFVALRVGRPELRLWPFVLLGLLANTTLFGTIWSLVLAAFFIFETRGEKSALLPGAALFVGFVVLAVATMIPAPDIQSYQATPSLELGKMKVLVRYVVGAFLPVFRPFSGDVLGLLGFANSGELAQALDPGKLAKSLLARRPVLVGSLAAMPVLACWIITRDRWRTAEYAGTLVGILLFARLWGFAGWPRHYGFLFVAFVAAVWMTRSSLMPERRVAWLWIALLVANAVGGLTTLAAGDRPFSQARNTSAWIKSNGLDKAFLMGTSDLWVTSVAGYLNRRIYYLECECFGTYAKWSTQRKHVLTVEEVIERVAHAMKAERKNEAYLVVGRVPPLQGLELARDLNFVPIKRFEPATTEGETYIIYHVTAR